MSNILVTGGTGFIGSYIARRLLDDGHRVVCFDNIFNESRQKFIGDQAVFHIGDMTRIEEIISVIKDYKIEKIVAMAFLMPEVAEKNLQLATHVNILGVNNVFEAARLSNIKRVVYSSSISVYGHFSWFGDKPVREVPENFRPPHTVYGAAKQFNEFMAGRYNQNYQMEIICMRLSIVFGYGRMHGVTAWIDNMISNPVRGIATDVPRKSTQKINIIYVKDLAEIFSTIVNASKVKERIYNTGRHTTSLLEMSEIVKKHFPQAKFSFKGEEPPFFLAYYVNDSRLRTEFSLSDHSLEDNILDQMKEVKQAEGL